MYKGYKEPVGYKYAVVYNTKTGTRSVLQLFKTKREAIKQVSIAKKSSSFKKLGYKNPRVVLNKL